MTVNTEYTRKTRMIQAIAKMAATRAAATETYRPLVAAALVAAICNLDAINVDAQDRIDRNRHTHAANA